MTLAPPFMGSSSLFFPWVGRVTRGNYEDLVNLPPSTCSTVQGSSLDPSQMKYARG